MFLDSFMKQKERRLQLIQIIADAADEIGQIDKQILESKYEQLEEILIAAEPTKESG